MDLREKLRGEKVDPFKEGVSRRNFLRSSVVTGAAASATATAGCMHGGNGDTAATPATVFVFNTGDSTVSLIDPENDEVIATPFIGATASYPSNQHAILRDSPETLWMNIEGGVMGVDPESLDESADISTGSAANWQEITPDGNYLIVSSREPVHTQFRIDADPSSDTYGEVLEELDRSDEFSNEEHDGPGPCDLSVGPDGEYSFIPDLFANTVTAIRNDPLEVVDQVDVEPVRDEADSVGPFMGTASWDGNYLSIENFESPDGTESIFDISDPENIEEIERFTQSDGLGVDPWTSEFGPDNEYLYVFTSGSGEVSVIDLVNMEIEKKLDVGGEAQVGSWEPNREKLYVSVPDTNKVKVVSHADR